MHRPSVVVADDHPVYRFGSVIALREAGFDVVGQAQHGRELIDVVTRLRPDAVVCDVRMPVVDGIEACRHLRAHGWRGPVLFVTTYDEPAVVERARKAGANGLLAKDAPMHEITRALFAMLSTPSHLEFPATYIPEFTGRELDVLHGVASGATLQEVASRLGIATSTAKDYLATAYEKLGVHDRVTAINEARRLGLVAEPRPLPELP